MWVWDRMHQQPETIPNKKCWYHFIFFKAVKKKAECELRHITEYIHKKPTFSNLYYKCVIQCTQIISQKLQSAEWEKE